MPDNLLDLIGGLQLGKIERRLIEVLARRPGHWIATPRLINAAYFDAENGGPLDAEGSIKQHIHHLRQHLRSIGYDIEGVQKVGRRLIEFAHG